MNHETRGRVIAQAFYGELEKIAKALSPRVVQQQAAKALAPAKRFAKDTGVTGLDRLNPFSEKGKTYRALVRKGSRRARKAQSLLKARERQAFKAIRSGTPDQRENASKYLRDLRAMKGKQPRPRSPFASPKNIPDPVPDPRKSSPIRRAAQLGALGVGASGAAYLGSQYIQSKKDPYSQYR